MKKKNVWVLSVFFVFICCYLTSSAILEDKLRSVADRYIDDACTCFAESANILFEYYKNNVNYLEVRKIEKLRRNELNTITEDIIYESHDVLKSRLGESELNLGSFVDLVNGVFISSENEYIAKDVLLDENQIEILNKFKTQIEETNTTCFSSSFEYDSKTACFLGMPIINAYDEYIGYKAVIVNLDYIEEFQTNYYLDFDHLDFRIANIENEDLITSNKFYELYNKRGSISKTVYMEEQNSNLTVVADDSTLFNYFYIYRVFAVVAWVICLMFLARELFAKRLTINKTFAYLSAVFLLFVIWAQGFLFDIVIHNIQVTSNYMQANYCCFKDKFWMEDNNEIFLKLQKRTNQRFWKDNSNTAEEYIKTNYENFFKKFVKNDKYGEYIYIIDKDGNTYSFSERTDIGLTTNPNWFNYNQYSFNTYYYETQELKNLDTTGIVLVLPIVNQNNVQCVICVVYDLQEYVDDLNYLLSNMSNEKLVVALNGDAYSLKNNQPATIESLDAKGNKPYLSSSGIGQYKLIKRINYKYRGSKTTYYIFDSFYANKRYVFLREDSGKEEQWIVLLITLLIETFLGTCTHIYNRSIIQYNKINDGTQLAIQNKLQTFK